MLNVIDLDLDSHLDLEFKVEKRSNKHLMPWSILSKLHCGGRFY